MEQGSSGRASEPQREALAAILGIRDLRPAMAPPVVERIEAADGHRRAWIRYPDAQDEPISALLLVPEGDGPFPSVLALHQHNGERH